MGPGANGEVRLDVTVPADAAAGTSTIRVQARGGGAQDILPVSIRVNAEAAGTLTLTTNTPELTGASDKEFKFDLQLKNDTAQDVTVSAAATGPAGWTVDTALVGATDAASTVVETGATQNISVTVTPAEGAPAETYPIQVTATAGDRTVQADLAIAVTGTYSMTLSTPGGVLSARGSAGSATTQEFEITNTGTAPLTNVVLEADPPSGWEVTVSPEGGLPSIEPNATGKITATITPSGQAVAGDYLVEVDLEGHGERRRGNGADPVHGRDVADLGDRRDRAHRPDPRRSVLRLPDLRPSMSSSPGRIASKRRSGRREGASPRADAATPTGPIRIRTRGLTKHYDDLVAVDHLDLDVRAGRDLRAPRPERRRQDHDDPDAARPHGAHRGCGPGGRARPVARPARGEARVGYLPDSVGFYGDLTGRENLRYTARLNRLRARRRPRPRSTRCSSRSA